MNKQELLRAKGMAPVSITRLLVGFDESDITDAEVKYRIEEDEDVKTRIENKEKELGTRDLAIEAIEKEVRDEVYNDTSVYERAYDDLCEYLTEELRVLTRTKSGDSMFFKVDVKNFGWRSLDGHKYIRVENVKELLQAILPDTSCTYRFFKVKHGKMLAMQNFHHDSPCGNEWYIIKSCAYSTYEENRR